MSAHMRAVVVISCASLGLSLAAIGLVLTLLL